MSRLSRLDVQTHRTMLRRTRAEGVQAVPHASVVLAITDDAGRRGCGEAAPLPGHSRDTAASAEQTLSVAARALEGATFVHHGDVAARVRELLELVPHTEPAARFALETALFDLAGHALERPLGALLPLGVTRETLALSALVDTDAPRESATDIARAGFRSAKLKIDGHAETGVLVERVSAVRAALGPEVALRLDANGSFLADAFLAFAHAIASAGILVDYVEEPCAKAQLADVVGRTSMRIALDESLLASDDAWLARYLGLTSEPIVVLKPTCLGGVLACLDAAERVLRRGGAATVTHTFEGPIARAALAQLALSLPGALPAGLSEYEGARASFACASPCFDGTRLVARDVHGHGALLTEAVR